MPDKMTIKIVEYSQKLRNKDYYETVEDFLRELNINVYSVFLVLNQIAEALSSG